MVLEMESRALLMLGKFSPQLSPNPSPGWYFLDALETLFFCLISFTQSLEVL